VRLYYVAVNIFPASYGLSGPALKDTNITQCVSKKKKKEIELPSNGLYSHSDLSGFNIMFDRERQTKFADSNDMTRSTKGDCVTRVDIALRQV
jgi:serine/threonine-protein kinase RIO1